MADLRWMSFVDGENFTMRATAVAQAHDLKLTEGEYYVKDVFMWLPRVAGNVSDLVRPSRGHSL